MITTSQVEREQVVDLIEKYHQSISIPLDDMWEDMIIPSGIFYSIQEAKTIGYFVVGEDDTLLQFYVENSSLNRSQELFDFVVKQHAIKGALVGTFEPLFLTLSLDKNKKVEIDTLLYQELNSDEVLPPLENIEIQIADLDGINEVISFCEDKVGLAGDWMQPYYQNLLPQGSVHLFKMGEVIIGAGELRPSKSSKEFANLGVMVSKDFRQKNIGTYIMNQMKLKTNKMGLKGICSTTIDNVSSQKTILKSGFYAYHRIVRVSF